MLCLWAHKTSQWSLNLCWYVIRVVCLYCTWLGVKLYIHSLMWRFHFTATMTHVLWLLSFTMLKITYRCFIENKEKWRDWWTVTCHISKTTSAIEAVLQQHYNYNNVVIYSTFMNWRLTDDSASIRLNTHLDTPQENVTLYCSTLWSSKGLWLMNKMQGVQLTKICRNKWQLASTITRQHD